MDPYITKKSTQQGDNSLQLWKNNEPCGHSSHFLTYQCPNDLDHAVTQAALKSFTKDSYKIILTNCIFCFDRENCVAKIIRFCCTLLFLEQMLHY
jgi:hypothetical protein